MWVGINQSKFKRKNCATGGTNVTKFRNGTNFSDNRLSIYVGIIGKYFGQLVQENELFSWTILGKKLEKCVNIFVS